MTVRNDGNVILKGCTVSLVDAETDTVVDSRDFSFLKESLCASAWNPELFEEPDEELETLIQANANKYPQSAQEGTDDIPHLFADPGANNVLLPGKTGLYSIQFDIPTDWHGTKKVHLKFDNYVYDTIVTAVDTGEEATPLHFSQQTNDDSACEVFVHAEVGDVEVNYFDPGVWVYGASGDPEPIIPGTGGGGSGTSDGSGLDPDSSSSGSGSSSGIPDTGDASLPTIAGLAATAAIAGFAAYSARRTALEREGQGDDMPGIDDEDKGV